MGLDMYLTGDKFTPTHDGKHQRQKTDGYEVTSLRLDLGQWRKHWACITLLSSIIQMVLDVTKSRLIQINYWKLRRPWNKGDCLMQTTALKLTIIIPRPNKLLRLQKSFGMRRLGYNSTMVSGAM